MQFLFFVITPLVLGDFPGEDEQKRKQNDLHWIIVTVSLITYLSNKNILTVLEKLLAQEHAQKAKHDEEPASSPGE